ncbi:MAG: hypothetical protein HQ519_17740 [Planctomycetes bacterium]|nr:hypothetical protein [Planctomycetota bacterium]
MKCLLLPLMLLAACSVTNVDEPILGTFEVDPVQLLRNGQKMAGNADLVVEHANFRYQFASAATRDEFLADPTAFEIQLGGGCGRMGALSGTGRTDLFTVHDGQLFVFASAQCAATFKRDPSKVLEPSYESAPKTTSATLQRGRDLVDLAVAWLGGAERLDRAVMQFSQEEWIDWEGKKRRSASFLVIAPNESLRSDSIWDGHTRSQVATASRAYFVDPETGTRTMQPAQRIAMERKRQRNVLALMQSRNADGFIASADGRVVLGGAKRVYIWYRGMNHAVDIHPQSGQVLRHSFVGWGPQASIGNIEQTYTNWTTRNGVKIPVAWDSRFDGVKGASKELLAAGYQIEIVDRVPAGTF